MILWAQFQRETVAEVLVVSGLMQIDSAVQLDLAVSPPISQPGDVVHLQATLLNLDQVAYTPEIIFQLPTNVKLELQNLPPGMTFNVKLNALTWLPVLAANGGIQDVLLPLRVETADIAQPEQEITAVLRLNGAEQTTVVNLWVGSVPQVEAILHPPQVSVGQPFQLKAQTGGSGPKTQTWHLGDGRTVKVNDPVVLFPLAGVYDVRLDVSNPLATASKTQAITVVPHPAAQFVLDDVTPGVDQLVTFLSQSGGAQPLQYTWDFGDGFMSAETNPTHQYATLGTYQVHLTVQNEFGKSEAYWPVTVGETPLADMVIPESGRAGEQISATGFGDNTVGRYEWAMGDGRYYEGQQINHTYAQTGDYYITMLAVNDYGSTEMGRWIHIDPGFAYIYLPAILNDNNGGQLTAEADILAGLDLPEVYLDKPFVMQSISVPPGSTPIEQLYIYINEARRQFDLPALANVSALNTAAQNHASDMAANGFTAHTGSDGSFPAERLLWYGYRGGYGGETTAWGFEYPYQAVEFWVNSPSHRRIILSEAATDVGVGFTVNYEAPNVWYWTAEFGNAYAAPSAPTLRLQSPANNTEALVTTPVTYAWNWPVPLSGNQQFVLYLHTNQGSFPVDAAVSPLNGTYYALQLSADNLKSGNNRLQVLPGRYEWQVKLEGDGVLVEGPRQTIAFHADPNAPTPTATATVTGTAVGPTPTPEPTGTATPLWPTVTPTAPPPTALPLITATPTAPAPTPIPIETAGPYPDNN
ncbi:MAG: PKD domain-containing protein [Chloroflexi bacterium]|nr:PKD domain-containing protein [Chloroflexota bacterium]